MKWTKTSVGHMVISLTLILCVMLLLGSVPARAETPEHGGILKIVNMAEGGTPIGVPWENWTIDTHLDDARHRDAPRRGCLRKVHPHLATGYKVDLHAKTITFFLRKGVKFHDGTDFDAEAAKWNFDQAINAKEAPGLGSRSISSTHTIRVHFKAWENDFPSRAGQRGLGMISPTAFKKNGKEWAEWNPVGTGPFKFVKFQRGNILQYRKNENYWMKGKPYLDGIDYLFIRDPLTQEAALRTTDPEQRIDVLAVTSGEQATMMKAQGFKILGMPIGPVSFIPDSANADSPFSKQKVREAVSYAIDREGIVKARGFGIWKPAYQIQPDNMLSYIPNFQGTPYNPQKAKHSSQKPAIPTGSRRRSS